MADPAPPSPPADRTLPSEVRACILSLVVSSLLMALKFWAYYLTRSAAIFSDAMENVVNVFSAAFALYAVLLAHRPADKEHPYGHGKIEFFSAGFEGGMILLAAAVGTFRSVEALALRQKPSDVTAGLLLMVVGMLTYGFVGVYLKRRGRQNGSITLEADGVHLLSDAVTSAVVVVALLVIRATQWTWVDPVAGLAVCAYIGVLAVGLLRRSAAGLMDEQDAADARLLRRILDAHLGPAGNEPRVCSYHKLRHRHSGRYHWIDFHLVVPPWWDIETGHKVASAIEYEIEQAVGEGNATAHIEPCTEAECPRCEASRVARVS